MQGPLEKIHGEGLDALTPEEHETVAAFRTRLAAADITLAAPLIACNEEHRFLAIEQLREASIEPGALLLEPVGRNTAPALTLAALAALESGSVDQPDRAS